jgi:lipoprotein-releasing system permease protein
MLSGKPLSLFLGWRYIGSRHGNGFSSFISASSILGIALGVMVLIVVLSAMNGFERELAKRLLSIVPHGEFSAVSQPIENWPSQIAKLEQHELVLAAAPVIKINGMLQKGSRVKGVEVRGVDLELEQRVSAITEYLPLQDWLALAQDNSIVIGSGVADKLGVKQGDLVQLLIPRPQTANVFSAPLKLNLNIVGVFDFGGSIDESQVYLSLNAASQAMALGDAVQGLRIKVADVFRAAQITRMVSADIDAYVYINDWTRTQGHLFNDIQLVRLVMFIVLVLVIAVASFNIVSTLIMVVKERQGDIAILKTMGAKSSTIMATFVIQGVFNGLLGCTLGGVGGVLVALYLTQIISALESFFGISFLSSDVYFVDFMPSQLQVSDVLVTLLTALLLTLIATIYPAWRASRVEPAQVLGQI